MASPTARIATPIEDRRDYAKSKTPRQASAAYWQDELKNSDVTLRRWLKQGDRIVEKYVDERRDAREVESTSPTEQRMRLNLFHSNVKTQQDLLYGRVPRVDVSRRSKDAEDDTARVAAVLLERILAEDSANHEHHTDNVLRATLQDRLLPGLGVATVKYDKQGDEEAAPFEYRHWRDVRWGWARTFSEIPWLAFRSYLRKEEAEARYGPDIAQDLDYKQRAMTAEEADSTDLPENTDTWKKAEVWQVWDKTSRQVYEVSQDHDKELKPRLNDFLKPPTPDPYELEHFFPCPPFLIANPTTSIYRPTPDWHLAQGLYNEIDRLQTRISILTEAVKAVGVYDKDNDGVQRMFNEATENELIPVDNWAMLAEKGGLKGVVDWLPIEAIVNALLNLRQIRDETIQLLYQITGMSDIMRGQLDNQYEGVGQTRDKMQFASIRMQALQEQFATFASGLWQIKAEVIAKHFDPATIVEQANAHELPEPPEVIAQAVALIKAPGKLRFKVKVQAESLAIMDYRKVQQERTEFLQGLGGFLQAASPLIEQVPSSGPYLLRMLQWALAGFRGADEIEGVLDQAVDAAIQAEQKKAQQPQPNPEAEKEQAKAQGQLQLVQAKAQAEAQARQQDAQLDIQTEQAKHQMEMAKQEAEFITQIKLIEAKANADMRVEQFQSSVNAEQHAQGVEAEMNKDIVAHRLSLDEEAQKTRLKIRETTVQEGEKRQTQKESPSSGEKT